MSEAKRPERIQVVADRSILWRELIVFLGVPSVICGFVLWLSKDDDFALSVPWVAASWVVLAICVGLPGSLPIWIRHHRTIIEATPARLTVRSGRRVLLDLSASEVTQIRVYGHGDWSSILFPYNHRPGPFPLLIVWSSNRWQSPPLMLWGRVSSSRPI